MPSRAAARVKLPCSAQSPPHCKHTQVFPKYTPPYRSRESQQNGQDANAENGEFSRIVDRWAAGGSRVACVEMASLAEHLVDCIMAGNRDVAQKTFVEVEKILDENIDDDQDIISSFVLPCLLEGLDVAIREVGEAGTLETFNDLHRVIFDLMGEDLQMNWVQVRSFSVQPGSRSHDTP